MFIRAYQKPLRETWRYFAFVLVMVGVTFCFWRYHHKITPDWRGIPPVPSYDRIVRTYLGDTQFGYRSISLAIHNFGDTGGRTEPIKSLDYQLLSRWFRLASQLDPISNYIPNIAAYYYGSVDDKERLRYVVQYLSDIGNSVENGKWRWLAQAVFLTRFKLEDQDLALELAYKLAALEGDDLPIWTDQMPAFVLAKVGEEQAAFDIMVTIMATDTTLERNEINYMCWYVNEKINPSEDILSKNDIYQALCVGRDF